MDYTKPTFPTYIRPVLAPYRIWVYSYISWLFYSAYHFPNVDHLAAMGWIPTSGVGIPPLAPSGKIRIRSTPLEGTKRAPPTFPIR